MTSRVPDVSRWLAPLRPDATFRLFCLPFAGGGANAFRTWRTLFPSSVDVCPLALPGREQRMRESAISEMATLVRSVADALEPALDRPYALFGHSMGAWVAFELARELRRRGAPPPTRLLLASRRAPHLDDPSPIADLPEEQFIRALQERYAAIPPQVLAEPSLLALFLPALRADFSVIDHYRFVSGPALEIPLTVWYGTEDGTLREELVAAWQQHTTSDFSLRPVSGGHFFQADARFVAAIAGLVTP